MSKVRCDSAWNGLTPEQKETVEEWLFEQNLGYDEVLERARKEFGVEASKSGLCRFYRSLARERLKEDLCAAQAIAAEAQGAEVDLATLRGGAVKMIGKRLIDAALNPGEIKELATLANLMLMSEQHEIQREWVSLARERFQFSAVEAARKIQDLVEQQNEEDMAREMARIDAAQRRLFGDPPEGMG